MILKLLGEIYIFVLKVIWFWWWVPIPFWLHKKLTEYLLWWLNWEVWTNDFRKSLILVEIVPPKNLAKTFKTMEDVFSVLWGSVYAPANFRETWLEGFPTNHGGPAWCAFEIAGLGGSVHFYARIPKGMKSNLESALYAHFPDAEIFIAKEDYTKVVPQDIPNDTWEMRGEDFMLLQDDPIPIKTYSQFFEPKMGKIDEERLIDPLHSLMEALTELKAGDQVWIQLGMTGIVPDNQLGNKTGDDKYTYEKMVAKAKDKARGKKDKPKGQPKWLEQLFTYLDPTPLRSSLSQAMNGPVINPVVAVKPEEKLEPLTPGETDKLKAIEEKASKRSYLCFLRTVYIYNKSVPHIGGGGPWGIARLYVQHFTGYNGMRFYPGTRTKIHYILRPRLMYVHQRKLFKNYLAMNPPISRWAFEPKKGLFVLNIEELATIFHFPNQLDAPRVYQFGAKKGEPPINLPTE